MFFQDFYLLIIQLNTNLGSAVKGFVYVINRPQNSEIIVDYLAGLLKLYKPFKQKRQKRRREGREGSRKEMGQKERQKDLTPKHEKDLTCRCCL